MNVMTHDPGLFNVFTHEFLFLCVFRDPNGSDIVWPKLTSQGLDYLKMTGEGDTVEQGLRHRQCAFRASILPLLQHGTVSCGGSTSGTSNRIRSAAM